MIEEKDITIGGKIYSASTDTVNLDYMYGPYYSTSEALNKINECGKSDCIGLTVGVYENGGVAEYVLESAGLVKKVKVDNDTIVYENNKLKVSDETLFEKVDKPKEPVAGMGINVPYYFDVEYNADNVVVNDYTVDLLNKDKDSQKFSLEINAADEKAGLMKASDAKAVRIDLPTAINTEKVRAEGVEYNLNTKIDGEIARAKAAEKVNADNIAAEISTARAAEEALNTKINTEIADRQSADTTEKNERTEADSTLQTNINNEKVRAVGIENGLRNDLTLETNLRTAADTNLQTNIDTEKSDRQDADATLQTNINNEATTRSAADTTLTSNLAAETATRTAKDAELQTNLSTEKARAEAKEAELQTNINTEAATRDTADTTLQTNIDAEETRAIAAEATKVNQTEYNTKITEIEANVTALDINKINKLGKEAGSGEDYHLPYHAVIRSEANKINLDVYTIAPDTGELKAYTSGEYKIEAATATLAGLMSATDKEKLDGIEDGAQVNIIEHIKIADTEQTPTDKTISIPAASASAYGVLKTDNSMGLRLENGALGLNKLDDAKISGRAGYYNVNFGAISTDDYDLAVKHALCDDAVGAKNPDYTDSEKQKASKKILPTVINSKFLNTTADGELAWSDLPIATTDSHGTVRPNKNYGTNLTAGSTKYLTLVDATATNIENRIGQGVSGYGVISTANLNIAVKAALTDDNKISMSETEQASARSIIDAASLTEANSFAKAINTTETMSSVVPSNITYYCQDGIIYDGVDSGEYFTIRPNEAIDKYVKISKDALIIKTGSVNSELKLKSDGDNWHICRASTDGTTTSYEYKLPDKNGTLATTDDVTAPIQSISVNGTAIAPSSAGNVALPIISDSNTYGLVKYDTNYGISINTDGGLATQAASVTDLQYLSDEHKVITPSNLCKAVKTIFGINPNSATSPSWSDTEKATARETIEATALYRHTISSIGGVSYYLSFISTAKAACTDVGDIINLVYTGCILNSCYRLNPSTFASGVACTLSAISGTLYATYLESVTGTEPTFKSVINVPAAQPVTDTVTPL